MQNDGGIKRGDGAETGDNEARPNDGTSREGSGVWAGNDHGPTGRPTANTSSLGATDRVSSGSSYMTEETFTSPDEELTSGANIDDLTILPAEDESLGLTNIGNKPPEDWAADTGPTHTGEEWQRGLGED